ncbi:MAG: TIGR04283 family arsenosugar biosynthesis glycosyltransferase [Synechococcales cyanobacterium C42_A2020_086]|nr:TIGR04283 family arsenosugar biosynthesis glycosyltransferase [Synechococcales cyanobacterium C42_A2020_086]
MVETRDQLILFTRYPLPGRTKTRLIPALGAAGAAALQRQMTEHTLNQVRSLLAQRIVSVEIWFAAEESASTEAARQQMQDWLGSDWSYQAQPTGDLGLRMADAFQHAFAAGMQQVVIIGTDCPGLDASRLAQAFAALTSHDLVVGPATDGGYYLIGLRQAVPALFVDIDWGTATVFSQTMAIAERCHLSVAVLDPLTDIDRPDDLSVWQTLHPAIVNRERPFLSIIIPALNEAHVLPEILLPLVQQPAVEVIVVDGTSQDSTATVAAALGATVLVSPPGRAQQMNAGAAIAQGEVLLFLHADTCLPDGVVDWVQKTLAQPGTIAGAFELQIAGTLKGLCWIERGVNWRSRYWQLPYGDQGLFLRATTFREQGGFPELPIMEDYAFVQQLKSRGRIAIAPVPVVTSGRRWQKLGILKTTLINQLMIVGYWLGVSPHRLVRWYRGQL